MIKSWSRRSSPYSLVVFQNGFIAGDPTILGWTTFAFYLVVAFLPSTTFIISHWRQL
jgi:hypothetical protein